MIDPNSQFAVLARLMDVSRLRNEVIAQNVANVNTPGHRCLDVQFEDALAGALESGDAAQILQAEPRIATGAGGAERADGNDVDIDRELGRLQKNSMLFELYAQVLSVQIAQYRSAIQGR